MLSWRNSVHEVESFWVWSYGLSLIFLLCALLSWITYCKLSSCCSASLLRSPSLYTHVHPPIIQIFLFKVKCSPISSLHCLLAACVVLVEASGSQDCCSYLLCQSLQQGRPWFSLVIVFNQGGCFRLPITNIQIEDYRKHPKKIKETGCNCSTWILLMTE